MKPKLLIAEDDPLVRGSLERVLSETFEVIQVGSGREATDRFFEKQDIRLVMSSGQLNESDGATLHATIKSELERRKGKFFLITGGLNKEGAEYFRRRPVPIFHKPFDADELRSTLLAAWEKISRS